MSDGTDYYAVFRPKGFLLHAKARDHKHAMSIARQQGHKLPRGSRAVRIGQEGYFKALAACFQDGRGM